MPIKYDFEQDNIPTYKEHADIVLQKEIERYEKENPDYKFHELKITFDELKGISEIQCIFKHKKVA